MAETHREGFLPAPAARLSPSPAPIFLFALGLLAAVPRAAPAEPARASSPSSPPSSSSLPDSVLARVGPVEITRAEFLRQWTKLGPSLRPPGKTLAQRKRAFLDELVHKEALSLAIGQETYTPTALEQQRLDLERRTQARQLYYERMVLDSLPPADPAASSDPHAGHHGHGHDMPAPDSSAHAGHGGHDDAGAHAGHGAPEVTGFSDERNREDFLVDRLLAPLQVRYDDSTAALLARAFGQLPKPREEGPGWIRMQVVSWLPPVPARDTARVLARTTRGEYTVGRFLGRWDQIPVPERDRPDEGRRVIGWVRSFLAQEVIDEEASAMGLDRLPQVEAGVAHARELMALEGYYRKHVTSLVDTSEVVLRRRFDKNPDRYREPPAWHYYALWYPTREDALAGRAALERGTSWDSVVSARYPPPSDPEVAKVFHSEGESAREMQTLAADAPDSTLRTWFERAKPGQVFGPREHTGQWWVYRFSAHAGGKRPTFEEARQLVLEEHLREESERRLIEHLRGLVQRFGLTTNEKALARLETPPEPGSSGTHSGTP